MEVSTDSSGSAPTGMYERRMKISVALILQFVTSIAGELNFHQIARASPVAC